MSCQLQLPHHQHQRPALGEGELRRAQPDQAAGRPAPEHSSPQRFLQFGKQSCLINNKLSHKHL